jgi:CheY-like chemotaxis protein
VSDTGIGISEELLPMLFQPFEQGERTTSRRFGGLGLGLVISKGIMDLHQGTLTAFSAGKGKGTTMTIEVSALPVLPDAPPPEKGEPAPASINPVTVLLVEDHADTMRCMRRLIKFQGHRVLEATTVAQAIDQIVREPIDLLVSDIGLPDGSGLDVMQSLKVRQPHAKGIALSGFGLEEDMRRSRDAGFVDHIVKPVNLQRLEKAIRSAVSEQN